MVQCWATDDRFFKKLFAADLGPRLLTVWSAAKVVPKNPRKCLGNSIGVSLLLVVGPASEDLKVSSNPAGVKHPVGFNRNGGAQVNLRSAKGA